jgi:hypothetical protein
LCFLWLLKVGWGTRAWHAGRRFEFAHEVAEHFIDVGESVGLSQDLAVADSVADKADGTTREVVADLPIDGVGVGKLAEDFEQILSRSVGQIFLCGGGRVVGLEVWFATADEVSVLTVGVEGDGFSAGPSVAARELGGGAFDVRGVGWCDGAS